MMGANGLVPVTSPVDIRWTPPDPE
jgi:hypothetical protein